MKRRKVVVGISLVCLFIAAIAIPTSFGGGIGLRIEPPEITVKPGTLITYDITLSSHDSDCYDVTVIPYTCNINWFEWTGKKQVCVPAGGKGQILLNVRPSQKGNFEFKVKAVSIRDPRTRAEYTVKIESAPYWSDLPDFIITKIWQVGWIIHYELMNVGFADAPAGSTTALYINGVYKSEDPVNTPLAPNARIQRSFNNFWGSYPFQGYTIKVCANYDDAIKEIRDNNDCLEENWFNQPYEPYTTGPTTPIPGSDGGGLFTSNPGVGGDGQSTYKSDVEGVDGPTAFKSSVGGGVNGAPTCIALMPDWPQPQSNGMVINWTACAFDPEGDALLYRFVWGRSDLEMEPLEIVQDWSPSNVWKWETNEGDISMYNVIYADVRDGYHANDDTDPDYDKSAYLLYWIE